jgi:hypothetical protein
MSAICNVCLDMMVNWVLSEKRAGRMYADMRQAIPAFESYLRSIGWTPEQAGQIADKAAA